MANSIWERYGGYSFVAKAVDDFYARVLLSRNLVPYFENINMERLIEHQIETIGAVMGGPYELDVEMLRVSHAHLKITQDHFNEVTVILAETLKINGLSPEDTDQLMAIVATTQEFIVDSPE